MKQLKLFLLIVTMTLTSGLFAQETLTSEKTAQKSGLLRKAAGAGKILIGAATVLGSAVWGHHYALNEVGSFSEYVKLFMPGNEENWAYLQEGVAPLPFSVRVPLLLTPFIVGGYMIKKGVEDITATSNSKPSLLVSIGKIVVGAPAAAFFAFLNSDEILKAGIEIYEKEPVMRGTGLIAPLIASAYLLKDGIQECYQAYKQKNEA